MDLKNATAVCLISLFSATLVVLIARALDSQAASQLEPQLTTIAEELQAIRKQGGMSPSPGAAPTIEPAADRLVVYFFHATARCPSCEAVEATTQELLTTEFASQYNRGEITWKALDYTKPAAADLVRKFKVGGLVIVLARMKDNQLQGDGRTLGNVMALAGDKAALREYLRGEIQAMLAEQATAAVPKDPPANTSAPKEGSPQGAAKNPLNIPIPE